MVPSAPAAAVGSAVKNPGEALRGLPSRECCMPRPRGAKRGPNLFKQRDLARALRSVKQAGARSVRVRLTPSEITMHVDLSETAAPTNGGENNPWDEVYDQDAKRTS
jgi:hypothetical protein